jgi:hypothetical protein
VAGYSARAVESFELDRANEAREVCLLPTFFPDRLATVNELTRASLELVVEDLDNGRVELHVTRPVWLLARSTAPFGVRDPSTGEAIDLTPYLGAYVTPNAEPVLEFLGSVADHHPDRTLLGYQGSADAVEPQVRAAFDALKDLQIRYVNSVVTFGQEEPVTGQRVRLPGETLRNRTANCLDGVVLIASLLEAMSLRPALVLVPGHAVVAWETWPESDEWGYLDTTLVGSHDFETAHKKGARVASTYADRAGAATSSPLFRRWPLRQLRTEHGITPMA